MTAPDFSAGRGAAPRPGRRWPLVVGDTDGAPPGVAELAAGIAWCFPLGEPGDAAGVLVIGDGGQDRLPHDVAALAADLACRIGFALNRARLDAGPADTGPADSGPADSGPADSGQPPAGQGGADELDPAWLVGHKS